MLALILAIVFCRLLQRQDYPFSDFSSDLPFLVFYCSHFHQDSGHAFVYEKYSGSVVSLLKADKSTCNGIVPHPTLPIFITYGIESTAKLWR